jgi:regulator of protease activity HflC (stomatin/prohibitin superfamily)
MIPSWLVGALAAVLLAVVLLRLVRSTIIYEFERGLRFRRGRFAGVVGPGLYWHLSGYTRIQKVDIRPTQIAVAGQEVLSSDGVGVKASVAATYQVVDPERAVLGVGSYPAALHTELQLALRAVISGLAVEELLDRRPELSRNSRRLGGSGSNRSGSSCRTPRSGISPFPASSRKSSVR